MYGIVSIVYEFWLELFMSLNNLLTDGINLDLKLINVGFYSGDISLFNYLVLLATLLTLLFVIYLTYKFFVVLYKVVARLWY